MSRWGLAGGSRSPQTMLPGSHTVGPCCLLMLLLVLRATPQCLAHCHYDGLKSPETRSQNKSSIHQVSPAMNSAQHCEGNVGPGPVTVKPECHRPFPNAKIQEEHTEHQGLSLLTQIELECSCQSPAPTLGLHQMLHSKHPDFFKRQGWKKIFFLGILFNFIVVA